MAKLIKHLTFGSCGVHDGTYVLAPMGFTPFLYGRLGFGHTPYALSAGAAVQLYDFCTGELTLPEEVRILAYGSTHQPSAETRGLLNDTEIAFVELSTPVEPMIGDTIVNLNRVEEFVLRPLREAGVDALVLSKWIQALVNIRPDVRERAQAILEAWPDRLEDDGLARLAVESLHSRLLGVDETVRNLGILRDKLKTPVAVQLYDFKYMPDGRAFDWPVGFKSQQVEVARQLNLPTLDLHPVVKSLGGSRIISTDLVHWKRDALPLQAELTYDFMAFILNRPPLETYSDWAETRPSLLAGLPELLERPARLSFPGLAVFPRSSTVRRTDSETQTTVMGPLEAGAPAHPSALRLAENLNQVLVPLHRRRLEELGSAGSGLFAHYQARIEVDTVVHVRERAAFDLLCAELPEYDTYVVIRAGIGELAFLIASSGRQVIACDPEPSRRAAIEAGRDDLEAAGLIERGAVTVLQGWRPETAPKGRVLGVALDAVLARDEAGAAALLPDLLVFDGLFIEPRLFLRMRAEQSERDALSEELRITGFDQTKAFAHNGLAWYERSRKPSRWWARPERGSTAVRR